MASPRHVWQTDKLFGLQWGPQMSQGPGSLPSLPHPLDRPATCYTLHVTCNKTDKQ